MKNEQKPVRPHQAASIHITGVPEGEEVEKSTKKCLGNSQTFSHLIQEAV